ncbi:MAG: hypothetical protein J0J10_00895 [Bosea sp.]|uniref:hypothetical protein n=1 Tax=Bosea sp. (in: a-proteobacteria) TaxID=1871050 RepID=UPI001AC7FFB1|nr:hypothetical protein [Bosea sp. (in: a-proteobacteria)]MBN9467304.1 hypothetical protein [Bosea sp. (in: a-proteobacteria)]
MAANLRTDELEAATAILHRFSMLIENGLAARFSGWLSSGGAWQDFVQRLETAGYNPALLALSIVAICLIAITATAAIASSIVSRLQARSLLSAAAWFAAVLVVVLASWVLLVSLISDQVLRRALLNCVVISAAATTICFPLTTGRRSIFSRWRRDLAVAIGIASGGLVVLACLRVWNAADPLRDLFATFAVSLPFTVLVAAAYLRHRRLVTRALSFGSRAGSLRRKLAAIWPWLVVAIVLLAFAFIQLDLTIGRPTRGGLLLISLLLALAAPHLDVAIERRGWLAARSRGGELTGALWRTFRIVVASSILAVLGLPPEKWPSLK